MADSKGKMPARPDHAGAHPDSPLDSKGRRMCIGFHPCEYANMKRQYEEAKAAGRQFVSYTIDADGEKSFVIWCDKRQAFIEPETGRRIICLDAPETYVPVTERGDNLIKGLKTKDHTKFLKAFRGPS